MGEVLKQFPVLSCSTSHKEAIEGKLSIQHVFPLPKKKIGLGMGGGHSGGNAYSVPETQKEHTAGLLA
jgi:hypothetical protein